MGTVSRQKVILLACGSFSPITNMHLRMFELARDSLNSTGKYQVVKGIISPVHDSYGKKDLVGSVHRVRMAQLATATSDWIQVDPWECERSAWSRTLEVLRHHQAQANLCWTACCLPSSTAPDTDPVDGARQTCHPGKYPEGPSTDEVAPPMGLGVKRKRLDEGATGSCTAAGPRSGGSTPQSPHPVTVKLLCGADLLQTFAVPDLWAVADIEEMIGNHGLVVISREGAHPERFIYESDVLTRLRANIHLVTEWISNDISATKIRRALRRGESTKYLMQDSVIDYIQTHGLYRGTSKDAGCIGTGPGTRGSKIFC